MNRVIFALSLLGIGATAAVGCGDDEITRTIDCAQICERYDECVSDIDMIECTDRCEDRAESSESIERRAELCEECLDGRSCDEAEPCWEDCPVVAAGD